MSRRRQRLSSEEKLMVFVLVLITSTSLISSLLRPRWEAWPQISPSVSSAAAKGPSTDINGAGSNSNGALDAEPTSSMQLPGSEARSLEGLPNFESGAGLGPSPGTNRSEANAQFAIDDLTLIRGRTPSRSNGEIQVVKSIFVDGDNIGNLEVTVSAAGNLIFKGNQLKALLSKRGLEVWSGPVQRLDNGPVSFKALKDQGVRLRYSPERDAFEL